MFYKFSHSIKIILLLLLLALISLIIIITIMFNPFRKVKNITDTTSPSIELFSNEQLLVEYDEIFAPAIALGMESLVRSNEYNPHISLSEEKKIANRNLDNLMAGGILKEMKKRGLDAGIPITPIEDKISRAEQARDVGEEYRVPPHNKMLSGEKLESYIEQQKKQLDLARQIIENDSLRFRVDDSPEFILE